MELTPGTRLGPYEVLAPLGSGGMGEVYAARDTRLDRRVAIKVSKAQFSERFEREARAVAALNHPHICQLYDVGPNYLVMELVEGTPVGPVADVRQLLELATQIADGLAAAHAVGIVHRDIKPSNLLVTASGQVKILDFGLATVMPTSTAASDVTREAVVTEAGTLIGTAAYMSPEQARGEPLDARTDLWSLGVVLYEMATATRPFGGPTSAVVFEELLSRTPTPVRQRNPKIPADLERVIERLLEKDRETRYQSAVDVRADLKRVGRDTEGRPVMSPTHARASASTRRKTAVAMASALALVASLAVLWRVAQPGAPTIGAPSEYIQLTNFSDSVIDPSLSPDGRMVTFIRSDTPFVWVGDVYVKLLSGGDAVRLTNGAAPRYAPVFTPDGSQVAYTQRSPSAAGRSTWDTWTVPIGGGEPTRMLPNAAGLVWIDNQHVLFSEVMGTGLHMGVVTSTVSRSEQRAIYFPGHERAMAHYSYLSPDRRWVLISEMDRTATFQPCRLTPFDGNSPGKQVGPPGMCTATAWSPDGQWMYFSSAVGGSSHLWRQGFPDGQPEQLTFGPGEEFGVSLASDGRSLVTAVGQQRSAIWLHDSQGERQITTEGVTFAPYLSVDGQRLYYLLQQNSDFASSELRSIELSSGKTDRLLPDRTVTQYDISTDQREVAFTTMTSGGVPEIWLAALDRSVAPRRIAQSADTVSFAGSELIFRSLENTTNFITRVRKDGTEPRRVMETPVIGIGDVSPNGRWAIVFPTGTDESKTQGALLVSLDTGTSGPLCAACRVIWAPDGTWLYAAFEPAGGQAPRALAVPLGATQEPPDSLDDMLNQAGKGTPPPGGRLVGTFPVVLSSVILGPGRDASIYAFTKRDMQRNLYRIPLH